MLDMHIDLRETHMIPIDTREWIVSPQICPALRNYGINLVGLSDARSGFQFRRPDPNEAQLLVCIAGEGEVLVNGVWEKSGPGTAYLTPPHVLHAYRSGQVLPWKLCWVMMPHEGQQSIDTMPEHPILLEVDPRPLQSTIRGLHREAMQAAEPAIMNHWVSLIHAYAQRMMRPVGVIEARLRQLWDAVEGDLAYPWDVETLSAHVGVSGEHLRRSCQQQFSCSPMRYVTTLRMRQASALLASDSYSVQAIANLVGYDNAFAFSTAFKRHTGLSPSQYRQSSERHQACG